MSTVKMIDVKTAHDWMASDQAVLIDVREPIEYDAMHITGAKLIPATTMKVRELPDVSNKKLIVHCRSGARAGTMCEKLLANNPDLDVYNLDGGIIAWEKAGFAVEKSSATIFSIDRQVQLTIGSGVLLGLLMGTLFHSVFLLISAFFGAGLIYAGLSGTCTLAVIMARMPWNQKK